MKVSLRSLFFIPIFVLVTIVMSLIALVITLFDKTGNAFRKFGGLWARIGLWLSGVKLRVIGEENYDPKASYVIVSNHASMYDILAALAGLKSNLRIMAKIELAKVPLWGWAVRRGDFIFIRRGGNREALQSLLEAKQKLDEGKSAYIFADGTRSPDGTIQPFKRGAFTIAVKAQKPILPITILGSHKIMPRDTLRINGGTITLVIDKPIAPDGKTDEQLLEETHKVILANYHKHVGAQ
ncbi:MAG: lysophospholipid acyltransferase family protein [Chloroherpetonaceae bacterium]|nr:lysophospholipid acyltransferase family protein [Chloroherpetonaceae bacterium]